MEFRSSQAPCSSGSVQDRLDDVISCGCILDSFVTYNWSTRCLKSFVLVVLKEINNSHKDCVSQSESCYYYF